MITKRWYDLRFHKKQSDLFRDNHRFICVVAGRRSGKTEISKRKLIKSLLEYKEVPDGITRYFYAAPTREQAKKIAWQDLKMMCKKSWVESISNSDLIIRCKFKTHSAELHVVGLDKPARIEGIAWDGGVVDESSDIKSKTFELTILPALADRKGWVWRTGVPKRAGIGAQEFKSFYEKGLEYNEVHTYHWNSSDILDEDILTQARNQLDEKDYREQFEASWESSSGCVYYNFSRENIKEIEYDNKAPLIVSSDFNITPMSWIIAQIKDDRVFVINEISINDCNTQKALDFLHKLYPNHNAQWVFYGDASGKSRKTSASSSDFAQISNDLRFTPKNMKYTLSNPRISDRISAVNRMICNANGERKLFVGKKNINIIKELESLSYKDNGDVDNQNNRVGHITDALGYFIHREYPIQIDRPMSTGMVSFLGI